MSIQVKSIDVYGIEARLRKSKTKEDKETLQYINALKEAHIRKDSLINDLMFKIKSSASKIGDLLNQLQATK